jgi:hypothetical protein
MAATEEKQNIAESVELLGAIVLFSQLSTAGLILALAERRAVDPARVFAFYSTLANAMETRPGAPAPAKAAARMLREIEAMARNMTTMPAGAGRG